MTYPQYGNDAQLAGNKTSLWQMCQILLRYGDAFEVLEPAELVALFRKSARGLADVYCAD